MPFVFYHNPNCSKSCQALQLLEGKGVQLQVRKYLEEPLSLNELTHLLVLLDKKPSELIRQGEGLYKTLGLDQITDANQLIQAMVDNPQLIERPILSNGQQARIGRPPEQVLGII